MDKSLIVACLHTKVSLKFLIDRLDDMEKDICVNKQKDNYEKLIIDIYKRVKELEDLVLKK